ncbi:MAG: glycosyl transferase [Phycisphaerae bacterium]
MADGPIRVLHVMPQIGIGGAETQLHALITRSDPSEVEHRVLYYSDSNDEVGYRLYGRDQISLTRVPRSRLRPVRFVNRLARCISAARPDIVHCWLLSGLVWGRLGALRAGVRHIVVAHRGVELARRPALRLLERFTGHRVHYLANSRACARLVAEQLGVCPERFDVIYNGIDVAAANVPPDAEGLKGELSIRPGRRLVLMVGRLTAAKNYPMLLRVARLAKGRLPVHFLLAGHGELEGGLRRLAGELGVSDTVSFLGLRRDIPRLLSAADVFCFTSRFEGFPNAVLEAMIAGRPIVTTDFPSARELITPGRDGTVVPIDDDPAMLAGLKTYLEDAALAARHGRNARATAVERFSMERMVRDTLSYYRGLLAGPHRGP